MHFRFMHDVKYWHSDRLRHGRMSILLQRLKSLRRHEQANSHAASYGWWSCLTRRASRPHKSIAQTFGGEGRRGGACNPPLPMAEITLPVLRSQNQHKPTTFSPLAPHLTYGNSCFCTEAGDCIFSLKCDTVLHCFVQKVQGKPIQIGGLQTLTDWKKTTSTQS